MEWVGEVGKFICHLFLFCVGNFFVLAILYSQLIDRVCVCLCVMKQTNVED